MKKQTKLSEELIESGDESAQEPVRSSVTKSELINRVHEKLGQFSMQETEAAVQIILNSIVEGLRRGHRCEIRNFGSFAIKKRNARIGRNPKTGESVNVPEKYVPFFKPGKELKQSVNAAAGYE